LEIRKWLPIVEDYARTCVDGDYLRIVSSFLHGKPRSYFQYKYDAHKAANGDAEPADHRAFFRETMISGYGLSDQTQVYWDYWNNLRQLPNMDINDYNVAFSQALTDLGDQIQEQHVKIEKYRLGLQSDMREMVRTSPSGTCWETLKALVEYCLLQWPIVAARIAKRTKPPPAEKVGGKRKASGGGGGSSSKPKSGATGRLSEEQKAHNIKAGLCHIRGKPCHIARDCRDRDLEKPFDENKKKKGEKDAKFLDALGSTGRLPGDNPQSVSLDLTVEDFLDVSKTLGRVFEIGVSHTNGDLATDWSPSSSFLAPELAGKHVWLNVQNSVELSERLRQFHSAYMSGSTDTFACILIRRSAPVDLLLLKNFVEVLTLPKGSLVRQLSDDGAWSIVKSPEKLRVLYLASTVDKVSAEAGLMTGCILAASRRGLDASPSLRMMFAARAAGTNIGKSLACRAYAGLEPA
jgi:hypothetical protein